ncbi:MAG: hypothetical protein JXB35_02795 [Anaerolineae bacterium]|nr:hypothetical protein [Anaerolineae bacterium]
MSKPKSIVALLSAVTGAALTAAQTPGDALGLGDALALVAGAGLLLIALPALVLAAASLLPGVIEKADQALERAPWRAFGVGAVNLVFAAAILLVTLNVEILTPLALVIMALLIVFSALGLAVIGKRIGAQLAAWRESPLPPLGQFVAGLAVLELGALVPFAGWFVLLPLCLIAGLGAVLTGLLRRT